VSSTPPTTTGATSDSALSAASSGVGASGSDPRMRHYTNRRGLTGIEAENVIRASYRQWESGCVYCENANRSPLSPRDAERYYGLKPGRGRDYVEFDTSPGEARSVTNPRTGRTEWVIDGDVNLEDRDPTFHRR